MILENLLISSAIKRCVVPFFSPLFCLRVFSNMTFMLLGFITKGILAIVWWRVRPFIEHKSWQKVFFYNVHTRQSGVNFKHLIFNFFRGDESFLLDLSLKFLNRRPSLCHFSPLKDGPMPMRLSSSEILVDSPSLNFFQINKKFELLWIVVFIIMRPLLMSWLWKIISIFQKITNWYDY